MTLSTQSPDSFRIGLEEIGQGATLRFEPDMNKLRAVVIHKGKVDAKLGGNDEFSLGLSGLLGILPGTTCVLYNKIALAVVLLVIEKCI